MLLLTGDMTWRNSSRSLIFIGMVESNTSLRNRRLNLPYTHVFDIYISCLIPSERSDRTSPGYYLVWIPPQCPPSFPNPPLSTKSYILTQLLLFLSSTQFSIFTTGFSILLEIIYRSLKSNPSTLDGTDSHCVFVKE